MTQDFIEVTSFSPLIFTPAAGTGADGAPGPKGDPGTNGTDGAKGDTGATGAKGDPGSTGATGATGATGPTGPTGPTGATGTAGPQGAQGVAGPTGPAGVWSPNQPFALQGDATQPLQATTLQQVQGLMLQPLGLISGPIYPYTGSGATATARVVFAPTGGQVSFSGGAFVSTISNSTVTVGNGTGPGSITFAANDTVYIYITSTGAFTANKTGAVVTNAALLFSLTINSSNNGISDTSDMRTRMVGA